VRLTYLRTRQVLDLGSWHVPTSRRKPPPSLPHATPVSRFSSVKQSTHPTHRINPVRGTQGGQCARRSSRESRVPRALKWSPPGGPDTWPYRSSREASKSNRLSKLELSQAVYSRPTPYLSIFTRERKATHPIHPSGRACDGWYPRRSSVNREYDKENDDSPLGALGESTSFDTRVPGTGTTLQ